MKITVIFTCFNRKKRSVECVSGLKAGNPGIEFDFVIVDDGSTDGTGDALEALGYHHTLNVIRTQGNCYYSGGMRLGMQYALDREQKSDYLLIVNDDVRFYEGVIEQLVKQSMQMNQAVIVGATCDESGEQTYGAVLYSGGCSVRYRMVKIGEKVACDTFNANCVLIPYEYFEKAGAIDAHYIHSLGDFDYGLSLKRAGASIYSSDRYVGVCERNSMEGTWLDRSLSVRKRLVLKENIKGAPIKQWFYFLKKNFGIPKALVFSITPYIKLMLGR